MIQTRFSLNTLLLVFCASLSGQHLCLAEEKGAAESALAPELTGSPKGLLETILRLSKEEKYEEIEQHVFPIHIGDLKVEKLVVEEIRKNDESSSGDYAYSDAGLEKVIEAYGDAFEAEVSPFWRREMGELFEYAPKLKEIPWTDYRVLDKGNIHVVVAKVEGSYKLLFWENMNRAVKGKE